MQKKEKVQTCGEDLRATRIAIAFCEKRENNAGPRRRELFRGGHHYDKGIIKRKKLQDIIF